MTLYNWSKTAASNSTADGTINWAEGQAPSSVNDSARAMMAAVAKWRDDNSGSLTTGGSSTAYTLTTNQVFSSLSAMAGQSIRFKMSVTNGASPTLAVDGLAAKALHSVQGTEVGTGTLLANSVVTVVYDNSNSCFVVVGAAFPPVPSGTLMLFQQTSAPSGWTKQSTHNDKALRVVTGSAGSGGSTAFTSVFASRTITTSNLPSHTHHFTTGNANQNHTHNITNGTGVISNAAGTAFSGGAVGTPVNLSTDAAGADHFHTGDTDAAGSGTAMDFAVQYVDVIIASKD